MTKCPANRPGAVTKVTGGRLRIAPTGLSLNTSTDQGGGKRREVMAAPNLRKMQREF
jgi:hypothetical protein